MSDSKTESGVREDAGATGANPAIATPTESKPAAGAMRTSGQMSTQPALEALTKEIRDGDLTQPIELTNYMFQLGLHFELPERVEPTVAAPAVKKKQGTRIWLVVLAGIVTLAGAVVPFLTRPEVVQTLPWHVLGEWQSPEPRYAGRKFVLSADRVRLDFGEHAAPVDFPISEVRSRQHGDTIEFQVLYRQESGLTQFQFTFVESTTPPTIQLPNPVGIDWVRPRDVEEIKREARRPVRGVVPPRD